MFELKTNAKTKYVKVNTVVDDEGGERERERDREKEKKKKENNKDGNE